MAVIVPFRTVVTRMVTAGSSIPTIGHLPDDVNELPCHVIGRPALREAVNTKGVMTMTLDVTLLGRRISDEDAQQELDALADKLFELLGGTRNIRFEGIFLRVIDFLPGTVIVAGMEYPAYIASVSAETVSC